MLSLVEPSRFPELIHNTGSSTLGVGRRCSSLRSRSSTSTCRPAALGPARSSSHPSQPDVCETDADVPSLVGADPNNRSQQPIGCSEGGGGSLAGACSAAGSGADATVSGFAGEPMVASPWSPTRFGCTQLVMFVSAIKHKTGHRNRCSRRTEPHGSKRVARKAEHAGSPRWLACRRWFPDPARFGFSAREARGRGTDCPFATRRRQAS